MKIPLLEVHLTGGKVTEELRHDVRAALTTDPKSIHPRWRWDARGSELYEQINLTPEYYAYRTEKKLLEDVADEIVELADVDTLVELGSGFSTKTKRIFDSYLRAGSAIEYFIPMDVSASALRAALVELAGMYPNLAVHGLVADFNRSLPLVRELGGNRRMLLFLGGTIGNLTHAERVGFFESIYRALRPGEYLLLGAGLVTDPKRLETAYSDSTGLCMEFNRNVLRMINRELRANFDPESFEHVVVWNSQEDRIEGFLVASRPMHVRVAELELDVEFRVGERFQTDISAKFYQESLVQEIENADFEIAKQWADRDSLHMLVLARRGTGNHNGSPGI